MIRIIVSYIIWTGLLYITAKAISDTVKDHQYDNLFVRTIGRISGAWHSWVVSEYNPEEPNYWRREWSYFRDLWHWADQIREFTLWLFIAVALVIPIKLLFQEWITDYLWLEIATLGTCGIVSFLLYYLGGKYFVLLYRNDGGWFR
jgi:hypothetical protein